MSGSAKTDAQGIAAALGAYLIWGLFGLYFKALAAVPSAEVLCHRILGGAVFAFLALAVRRQAWEVRDILGDWGRLKRLIASSLLIAVNWGLYIWAVAQGRALEASMGYFLFPLVSVVLARLALGEKLSRRRQLAVAVVSAGVAWMMLRGQGVPWVALTLGGSFGAYGLVRKTAPVSALGGLFIEAALLAPLAVAYLLWTGGGAAPHSDPTTIALIALAGPVTAIPLTLFSVAARRLPLTTLGLLMYINPSIQMAVAVLVFGEPFTTAHAVTFACIWAGLAIYSWPAGGREQVAPQDEPA